MPPRSLFPTAMRRKASSVHGLADVLEPSTSRQARPERPARVDFAFADTVHVQQILEEELPPASGPMIVRDETGHRRMNPLAYPPPLAMVQRPRDPSVTARAKFALDESVHEMKVLWHSTEGEDLGVLGRLRAIWAVWEWDRADKMRAAMIGGAVFALVATIGVAIGH